jgi:predicted NUDIX family phosphoesterase
MNNQQENILTFASELIGRVGYFQGLSFDYIRYINAISKCFSYTTRDAAEADPSLKQLVLYSIIMHSNRILTYRRGEFIVDQRLRSMMSIGFGGHVTIADGSMFPDVYINALKRELKEELSLEGEYDYASVAVLNDDTNDVGKVHFGIINVVLLKNPILESSESSILDLEFLSVEELLKDVDNYESWSRICLLNIDEIMSRAHEYK